MVDLYPFSFDTLTFSLEWLSAVTLGYDWEQRDVMRAVPRLIWNGTSQLRADDARNAEAILLENGGEFMLPDWRYAQRVKPVSAGASSVLNVSATGWPFLVDEHVAFIYKRKSTLATVTAVGTGTITVDTDVSDYVFPTAWMLPAKAATITASVKHDLLGYDQVSVGVVATVTDYRDLSAYGAVSSFNGNPVLGVRDVFSSEDHHGLSKYEITDNNIGPLSISKTKSHDRSMYFHSMVISSAKEMLATEAYLHTFAGRVNKFWKPSWLPDFVPQLITYPADTGLLVEPPAVNVPGKVSAVCIEYTDGTVTFHRVSTVATTPYLMTLNLLDPITKITQKETVRTISRMGLHRLDTDRIEFSISGGFATAFSVPTIEVLQ